MRRVSPKVDANTFSTNPMRPKPFVDSEPDAVRIRYARRPSHNHRYSLLDPAALMIAQERQRAIAALFMRLAWLDLSTVRLLEVGCGSGDNLLEFLRLGFKPEHLEGIELLDTRAQQARRVLPSALRISVGDAADSAGLVPPESQDVVYQSTVFSSLLDDGFQQRLADRMWQWVRPGGAVLWYDFTVNNPRNPDVRGISVARMRMLFPNARLRTKRLTLAPPIARTVSDIHPALYTFFNACPLLRTHVLGWAEKPM